MDMHNTRGNYSGTGKVMTTRFELQNICLAISAILILKLIFFAWILSIVSSTLSLLISSSIIRKNPSLLCLAGKVMASEIAMMSPKSILKTQVSKKRYLQVSTPVSKYLLSTLVPTS